MKVVDTHDAVKEIMAEHGLIWSHAVEKFRQEFYAETLHMIHGPEVVYDSKTDRNLIRFELNGIKHSVKIEPAAAAFVLKLAAEKNAYFGLVIDNNNVVVDVVAELWR